MNQIFPLLPSSNVIFLSSMHHRTKKRVFEEASLVFQMYGVPHTQVFEALFARERLGNNALGAGVALPHCRLKGIERPLITIVVLPRPIYIVSTPPDTNPVDIFFFLVVPDVVDDEAYLPLLRECIAMLENRKICDAIRNAENAVEVCAAIMNWTPPSALIIETQDDALAKEWDELNEEVEKVEQAQEELFENHELEEPPAVVAVETDPDINRN